MARNVKSTGIKKAKEIIESRRPKNLNRPTVFSLKKKRGVYRFLQPVFTFVDEEGNRVKVRYIKDQNSIFADEQKFDDLETIKLENIPLKEHNEVKDPLLRDFLLLHPSFGKSYILVDPEGEAEQRLKKIEAFDEVWDKVRSMSSEELKGLIMLLTGKSLTSLTGQSNSELRLLVRGIAEQDPQRVSEALNSQEIKTLYLYHTAVALGYLKYIPHREVVIWTDTQKELCKVPTNRDPGMWVAKQLLTDDFLSAKEILEKQIND